MNRNGLIKLLFIFLIIAINVGCDQITKNEARHRLIENHRVEVIKSKFILAKVENTGAAMSLGSNLSPLAKKLFFQALPIILLL